MNYDNYEQQETPSEQVKKCLYCGKSTDDLYCNSDCKKGYIADN